jgi:predicted outer membrane repeat protein
VNGEKSTETSVSLTLSGHAWVQAMFRRVVTVSNFDDPGEGTLRHALDNLDDGDRIQLSGPGTITLTSRLPWIRKSLTIEGNGTTLIRTFATVVFTRTPILGLTLSSDSDEALVRGLHFKNGYSTAQGGAIYHETAGNLSLESCIFSGNQSDTYGGAVFSYNTLTILGCTFYGNNANQEGGAIHFDASGKTLTLTGNLFYGNTGSRWPVVHNANSFGLVSASYNVVDKTFGTGETEAGWEQGEEDVYIQTGNPIDTGTFAPNAGSPGHTDIDIVPSGLLGFPAADFNGATRTFPGAAGAVN